MRLSKFIHLPSSKAGRAKVFGSFLFSFCCFLGCLYQLITVTKIFFEFTVSSRILIQFESKLKAPALTSCFRYSDIIYLDLYNQKYNTTLKRPLTDNEIRSLQATVNLPDVFNFTPDPVKQKGNGTFLRSCIIRSPQDYSHFEFGPSQCYEAFSVDRFQVQEYICYRFILQPGFQSIQPVMNTTNEKEGTNNTVELQQEDEKLLVYDFNRLSYALSYPSLFFLIRLSTEEQYLKNANLYIPIINTPGEYPFRSIPLARIIFRKVAPGSIRNEVLQKKKDPTDDEVNTVFASFGLIFTHKLPFPYETMCKTHFYDKKSGAVRPYSQSECLNDCVSQKTFLRLGKHPFTVITKERYIKADSKRLKIVSPDDISNNATKTTLKEIEKTCTEKCSAPSCRMDYSLTMVSTATGGRNNSIEISVTSPLEPYLTITRTPRITLNDYALIMLSLIGFWLGASVHKMNPAKLINRLIGKKIEIKEPYQKKNDNLRRRRSQPSRSCIRQRNILQEKIHHEMSQLFVLVSRMRLPFPKS